MKGVIKNMKEQFLNLSGLTELVTYIKLCIAQHKMIIPRASFSLFPKTGDENNIYIDTSTNSIYRWNDSDKSFVLLAKPPRNISISEGKNNGQITLKVDEIESNATVHGLKSAAFSNASSFATSAQGAKADSAIQSITIAPGTNNGTVKITVNGVTTDNIKVAGLGSAAFSDIAVFAPAKHTHSKSDVGLGNVDNTADIDKSVKYAGSSGSSNTVVYTALTNTDLNTLQTEGKWYYAGGGNTCTNVPVESAAFELYVGRNASGWRYQQFTVTSGEIYIRVFDSSNWGNWRKLAFTSDTVTAASSVPWSGITGKPSTFAPSSHNHTIANITDIGKASVNFANSAGCPQGFSSRTTATWGNQTGTVVTDWHTSNGGDIAFRDNSGQLNVVIDGFFYQNEGKNLVLDSGNYSNYAATKIHTHTISNITNLQTTLDGKSNTNHTHDLNSMINTLTNGTSDPVDTDYYIAQYAGGGSTTTTYHRRPHSALWNYIKSKANSVYQPKGSYAASSHTHDDRYYTESEMNTKLSGKSDIGHKHAISDVTNLQSTLDGKASSSHTHNYAGSSSAGGSANSAVKLTTARSISIGGFSSGSASFDGSGNITIDNWGYGCKKYVTQSSTSAPYFRIAYCEAKSNYSDRSMIFVIDSGYSGGGFGIVKVAFRSNDISKEGQSNCELKWLVRQGFSANQLFVKGNAPAGESQYADLYFKATTTYQAISITVLSMGNRGSKIRVWTFEEGNTRANPDIRKYTYTVEGSDAGTANYANSAGAVAWGNISGKPSTFTPASHTHSYAGAASSGGSATSAVKLDTATAGSSTQPVYFTGGKPTACTYTLGKSVPSNAVFTDTNTWRPLGTTANTACAGNDSRLSNARPASDVYSWAKASAKPSYSWSEIGSKPSTFTPSSHNHSYLTLYGGRPANINFNTSTNGTGAMFHFVATSSTTTGKPPKDANILQMNWDNHGGWDAQFAISNGSSPHSYIRSQNNGTWGNWTTLLDSSNYNNYSPSKTGTGASGTWGINITGASGSCTGNAATASNASKVNGHTVNSDVPSGAKFTDTNTWRPLGTAANTACAGNDSRLSNARPASDVYAWAKASSKPSYSWSEITSKPSTFTPASHTHAYIPLSGGTITGSIIRSSGGSLISARNNVAVRGTATGKDSWNPVVGQATPNGYWTIGNLASNDNLAFSYTSNTNYNAGNNSATTVYLPVQEGTIITSATIGSQSVKYATSAGSAGSVAWGNVSGKPSSYTPSSHTHDDRYYTETEINTKLGAKLGAVSANGCYGMARPDGNTSDWIRTTTAGIIPYQSGGAGAGHCGLGTSSWYFSNAYIDTVNCVNASVSGHIDVGGYIQSSKLINTYFEYQSNRGSVDWRFGAATGTGDENFFGFYDAKTVKIPLALDGNYGNIYVGFNVGSYESPTAVGVYLGAEVAGNRAFIYNGDSYQGSIWIQTRLDGSWKWFSLGRACSTALSDIRLKGNIRDTEVEDATKVIESMKIRSFERKDSHKKYKIGFIADELEQLDPNLVDGGGEVDGHPYYKSVNNLQMLAYVVKGMQELNSKVTILEKENKRLKQKLNMCN